MTMTDLAAEYRQGASDIRARAMELSAHLTDRRLSETEQFRLRGRIACLRSMYRDMCESASVMEHYYDRRFKRNGRYTV